MPLKALCVISSICEWNWIYRPEMLKFVQNLLWPRLDLELWPWSSAHTLLLSMAITPENFMIGWQGCCQKGAADEGTRAFIELFGYSQNKIASDEINARYYPNQLCLPIRASSGLELTHLDLLVLHIYTYWNSMKISFCFHLSSNRVIAKIFFL